MKEIVLVIEILKNLPNGKSVGSCNINSEMYKYGSGEQMNFLLTEMFKIIINKNVMPYLFNVGIIKPIVKDAEADRNEINNLRPITISDTLANIYEKILLFEIDKSHFNSDKQFGFKKNSSCNHAVFTLRETIIFSKQNKKKGLCGID